MSAGPDARPTPGIRAPNEIRGSSIVSRADLERQEAIQRQDAELERRKQAELARIRAKRSGGGGLPSWLRAKRKREKEAKEKADATQAKADKKAQREAEREAVYDLYRDIDKQAATQGVDVNKASFRINYDSTGQGTVTASGVKGTQTQEAKKQAEREQTKQIINDTIKDLKSQGASLNQTTIRVSKTPTGGYGVKVSDVELPASALQYENPTYNLKFGSKRIGDIITEETGKEGGGIYGSRETYDPKEIDRFLKTWTQYGEADDVTYTPKAGIFGKAGVFEGVDYYGNVRTLQIKSTIKPLPGGSLLPDAPKTTGDFWTDAARGFGSSFADLRGSTGDIVKAFEGFAGEPYYLLTGAKRESAKYPKGFNEYQYQGGNVEQDVLSLATREFAQTASSGGQAFGGKSDIKADDWAKIGQNIDSNRGFAAGSIAASAITFIPDKFIKGIQFAPSLFKATKGFDAGKSARAAVVLQGIKPEEISLQAVKISKSGLPEPIKAGLSTSKSVLWLGTKPIVVPKLKYTKADYFEILGKEGDLLGTVSAKTRRVELGSQPLSIAEGFKLVGQGKNISGFTSKSFAFDADDIIKAGGVSITEKTPLASRGIKPTAKGLDLKASDITQVYESYGTGKQFPKALTDAQLNAAEGLISKNSLENITGAKNIIQPKALPRASELTGSIIGLDDKTINSFLKGLTREAKINKAAKDLLGDLSALGKSTKKRKGKVTGPRIKLERQSASALLSPELTDLSFKQAGKNLEKALSKSAQQPTRKGSTLSINLGRGGAKLGLGLGGGVWPGKAINDEIEVLAYPSGTKDIFKGLSKEISKQGGRLNMGLDIGSKSSQGLNLAKMLKTFDTGRVKTVNVNDLLKGKTFDVTRIRKGTKQDDSLRLFNASGLKIDQGFAFDLTPIQTTVPKPNPPGTTPKFEPPTFPRIKIPDFAKAERKGKRKKRKGRVTSTLRTFEVKDTISAVLGEQSDLAKEFNRAFGKLY